MRLRQAFAAAWSGGFPRADAGHYPVQMQFGSGVRDAPLRAPEGARRREGSCVDMPSRVKNIFLGDPLHNEESRHQRLSQPDRARGLLERRDLVGRLRHRRDHPRALARRSRRSCTSRGRSRSPSARCSSSSSTLVPADDPRVSERRRLLHRRQGEPRRHRRARRRRVAAGRLRAHRRGVDLSGHGRDHLGVSRSCCRGRCRSACSSSRCSRSATCAA